MTDYRFNRKRTRIPGKKKTQRELSNAILIITTMWCIMGEFHTFTEVDNYLCSIFPRASLSGRETLRFISGQISMLVGLFLAK